MKTVTKVVIADDNKEFCELLKDFLQQQDELKITGVAYNGIEALEIIKEQSPDVLVLDVIMPHLDGIGVLEKLCESSTNHRPKVIVLTAFGQESITQKAVELGADYYILKPFDFAVLATRIKQLTGGFKPSQYISVSKPKSLDVAVTNIIHEMGDRKSVV